MSVQEKPDPNQSLSQNWNRYSAESRRKAADLITTLAKYGIEPNDPKVLELAEAEMERWKGELAGEGDT